MSALISLSSVSYQAGSKQLFKDLTLTVSANSRLGIVGPNGSGKSTLIKLLAGLIEPDEGRRIQNKSTSVAYVPQTDTFDKGHTVEQAVLSRMKGLFTETESAVYTAQSLSRAGFTDPAQLVSSLSGGWRKRLSLAAALAIEPELVLFDEPTNHLDLPGLLWLEELLQDSPFAWVLVSHDRYFLNRTVKSILEIAPYYPEGIFQAEGSYLDFSDKRKAYMEQQARQTSSLANKVKTELDWASRSPKARGGKAAFRMKKAARLNQELKQMQSRAQIQNVDVAFTNSDRQTKELVKLTDVSFGYEDKAIIKNLSFTFTNNMCLGLLGRNGQGKSTLLKVIGGDLKPDKGKVKHTSHLRIVYFDQLRQSLQDSSNLKHLLGDGHDHVIYQGRSVHIIGWAKRFGFLPGDLDKDVASLSGGEQARALLANLVRQEADLLILDEPTNDLDITMLEALESMLLEFKGAVILVTHDRFMLEEVCTHFLGFTADQELLPYASYEQWSEAFFASAENEESKVKQKVKTAKPQGKKQKLSYNEEREYKQIEKKILKAEEDLEKIEARAADPELHADHKKSAEVATELNNARSAVEKLYTRWEELEGMKKGLQE